MSSYRALLARPRARRLAASSAVGWWAFNGYGLALVLTIHQSTGSFATAGGATAAFGVGSAVLAPVRGRAVDRGGAPVLLWLTALHCCVLAAVLVGAVQAAPPAWLLLAGCAAAGASAPPLTALARRTWPQVAGPELARTSHALNATLGETAAIVSPLAVSVAAATASPAVALGALLPGTAAAAIGVSATARAVTTETASEAPPRGSLLRESPGLRWLIAGDVASGIWLGGLEVAAPAISVEADLRVLAGAPFIALAIGGIAASLWSGGAGPRSGPVQRYVWGAVAAALVLPSTLLLPTPVGLAGIAIAAGVAYGLINVALFELVDDVADEHRAVEAFTWITTAQASGLAIGASAAGALADIAPSHALLVVAAGAVTGAAAAVAGRGTLRQRRVEPKA